MAQNYTRQSSFNDGDTISASLFNDEYNQLVNSFSYSSSSESGTGHRHDGSAGQGGNIYRIGDLDFFNKIEADSANNRWGFWVEVGGSAVEQVRIQDGAVLPVTTNDIDLGSGSLEFKDLHLSGSASFVGASTTADISFGDNAKAIFGAGSDLQIYHDGSHSYISDQGAGSLYIQGQGNIELQNSAGTETYALFVNNGKSELYYDNAAKLATTSTGIDVTGTVTADGLTVDGSSSGRVTSAEFKNNLNAGGTEVAINLANQGGTSNADVNLVANRVGANFGSDFYIETSDGVDGTNRKRFNIGENGDISFYEDTGTTARLVWDASADALTFGNDVKATFGSGPELQIYYASGASVNLIESPNYNIQIGANAVDFTSYAGSLYATIDSSGINVTGTVTADGLTVDGDVLITTNTATNPFVVSRVGNTTESLQITFDDSSTILTSEQDEAGRYGGYVFNSKNAGTTIKRMEIAHTTGDISFYDSTGSSQSLFWDASAESLGVGTTSPVGGVHSQTASAGVNANSNFRQFVAENSGNAGITILSGASSLGTLVFGDSGSSTAGRVQYDHSNDSLAFSNNNSEAMRITSAGNVGIGTSTINEKLVLGSADSGSNFLQITNSTTTAADNRGFYVGIDANENARIIQRENADMFFSTNNTEVMTLDASGNVGIGTSSPQATIQTKNTSNSATLASVSNSFSFSHQSGTYTEGHYYGVLGFAKANSNGATLGAAIAPVMVSDGNTRALTFSTALGGGSVVERMRITDAGNVGIGTTSPSEQLHIANANDAVILVESTGTDATDDANIQLKTTNGTFTIQNDRSIGTSGALTFAGNTSNNIVIDHNSGNVGIGTSSPSTLLELSANNNSAASNNTLRFTDTDTATEANQQIGKIEFKSNDSSGDGALVRSYILSASEDTTPSSYISFGTNPGGAGNTTDERMRIDSNGNLLVGGTSAFGADTITLAPGGFAAIRNTSGSALELRRDSTDGSILDFQKDGTTVGSIQSRAGLVSNIILDPRTPSASAGAGLGTSVAAICPADTSGLTDAKNDLGINTNRFKDLYLSGGVYLGGTGAANLLDDYETGGWTPEIADAASGGNTGSATTSRVIYTKVGRLVTISCQLINVDTTGMTSGSILYIRGLPFASASANIAFGSIQTDNLTFRTSRTQIVPMIVASESFLTIKNIGDGLSDLTTLVSDVSSGSTDIYFSITYQAA